MKKTATFNFVLPVCPVPASRPRVTRRGHVYYGKNYTQFRKDAKEYIDNYKFNEHLPVFGLISLKVVFFCPKPKTSKRHTPRGDIDNYQKTLDVFNDVLWIDDDQIIHVDARKVYSDTPRIELEVTEIGELRQA